MIGHQDHAGSSVGPADSDLEEPGRRKITEHKTTKEARRSLKRRISNAIYRRILADQQRPQREAA
jgi:hypothetical protein